jgi:hypothetical protein
MARIGRKRTLKKRSGQSFLRRREEVGLVGDRRTRSRAGPDADYLLHLAQKSYAGRGGANGLLVWRSQMTFRKPASPFSKPTIRYPKTVHELDVGVLLH